MKNKSPMSAAAREMKRLDRLGSYAPRCIFCGITDWEMLTPESAQLLIDREVSIKLIEEHHPCGKAHDPDFTVPVCLNHHAVLTEDLRRADICMRPAADKKATYGIRMEALAVLHDRTAEVLRRYAAELESEEQK